MFNINLFNLARYAVTGPPKPQPSEEVSLHDELWQLIPRLYPYVGFDHVLVMIWCCRPQPPPEVTKPPGVLEVRPAPGVCNCDRHDWSPHFERARYLKNEEDSLMGKLLDVREEVRYITFFLQAVDKRLYKTVGII